ncbi:uncharacterized protein BDV17DRAFT_263032 [Aspergillus undulatus]|uniref:uncharacterized protein n=1 Tax=Aspergillus undulatus TaxID=1810928 RepID=UPI003CCE2715
MSDPFSIVGLAAAIAQFLDIGFRLVHEAKEIYDSNAGTRQDLAELQLVVEDIRLLNQDICSSLPFQPLSKDDLAIRALADQCNVIADSLLAELAPLEVNNQAKYRMLESVRVSMSAFTRRKAIQRLWDRLRMMETQLRERVARATQKEHYSSIMLVLESLRREVEDAGLTTSNQITNFKDPIAYATAPTASNSGKRYAVDLSGLHLALTDLLQEGRLVEHRQRIIESLTFKAMTKRHSQIDNAHFNTLDWVLDKSTTTLSRWLEEEGGIYWVTGLAGSGKSTLMKYISDHDRTKIALKLWAGEERLFVASFYFWNVGVDMQKSQLGLLQSILYQILRFDPSLVSQVCPNHQGSEPWDITELKNAFADLASAASSARFCFFIDGLDEYDGSEWEIIKVLKTLAQSKNVKICASSRPWAAFEKELTHPERMFMLQDFTRRDMENYVHSMLTDNDTFQELVRRDSRCLGLVPEIAERANGVWLWVFLVVRDLTRDIKNGETYTTLEARLRSLPQELNQYFTRILNRIDPFFRKDTARIFLIAVESASPLPLFALSFLESELKDERYALYSDVKTLTTTEISNVCADLRLQLQARCGDLLLVRTDEAEDAFFKHSVDFLHRTVRDFLRDNHHTALHSLVPQHFCSQKTLCRMLLALIKCYPVENFRRSLNGLFTLVDEFLYYAYELEQLGQAASQFPLLDEIDRVMTIHAKAEHVHWSNGRDSPTNTTYVQWVERGHCSYLGLATQARLLHYVEYVLDRDPSQLKKKGRPLLDYALRPTRVTPSGLPYFRDREVSGLEKDLVASLLYRGADPNKRIHIYGGQTVWELFVLYAHERGKSSASGYDNAFYEVACLLLDCNANLNHTVHLPSMQTHLGTTARYKSQVAVERYQVSAKELLSAVFTPAQMMTLDHITGGAKLRAENRAMGWMEWFTSMISGTRSNDRSR